MKLGTGRRAAGILACCVLSCAGGGGFEEDLRHPSPEKRVAAAEFLGSQREADAVPLLVFALRDSVSEVRAKAVWALGMIRAREARDALTALLADSDRRVRQASAWSLMQLEEAEAVPALEAALRVEKDPWVKADLERAVDYLRQFEGEADVDESGFR